jgi:hypothetical protein
MLVVLCIVFPFLPGPYDRLSLPLSGPVSEFARNYAIKQGEKAIDAIENYRKQRGSYPQCKRAFC